MAIEDALNIFTGGIDQSNDPRAIKQGDYIYAAYLRDGSMETASTGTQEFEIGNKELQISGMPTGQFVLVGKADWVEDDRNQIVLMMCDLSTNLNHTLVLFDIPTEGFTILETSKHYNFQFGDENRVYHAQVVNGQLIWTDGYFQSHLINTDGVREFNPPRSRNLVRLIAGDYSAPATFEDLDAIKVPPLVAPTATIGTDVAQLKNNIYGVGFKFRYCFIYDNNEISKWSPISSVVKTTQSDTLSGQDVSNPFAENQISIIIGTGDERVKKIQIAATAEGAQQGIFYIVKELDKAAEGINSNTTYTVLFYNDEYTIPIENNQINYDSIPDVAANQSVLPNKTHLAYADITEGFDNVEMDISLELIRTEITQSAVAYPEVGFMLMNNGADIYYIINAGVEVLGNFADGGGTAVESYWKFYAGDRLPVAIPNVSVTAGVTLVKYYTVTALDELTINSIPAFVNKRLYLNNQLMNFAITQFGLTFVALTNLVNGNVRVQLTTPLTGTTQNWQGRMSVIRSTNPQRNLLPGKKEIGIVYLDRGQRDGTVQINEDTIIYVPTEAEDPRTGFTNSNNPYTKNIRATLNHQPPEWATAYVFVAKQLPEASVDRRVVSNVDVNPDYPGYIRLTVPKYFYANESVVNKTITVGDELTFITGPFYNTGVINSDFNQPVAYQTVSNKFIVRRYAESEGVGNYEAIYIERLPYVQDVLTGYPLANYIIEINTPRKGSNSYAYKEVSPIFRVQGAHTAIRAHRGNIQDQNPTLGTPAIVDLNEYGDCWYRPRVMRCMLNALTPDVANIKDKLIVWTNTSKYSDFYESYWEPYGRLQVFNPFNMRDNLYSAAVHSESFIAKTATNGLFSFVPNNRVILPPQNGRISRIICSGGYVLTLLQARQETSIYVQRTFGLNGESTSPSYTDDVFAQTNPLNNDFGCLHPGSVAETDIGLIYWDQLNGCFVLSAGNGQLNLSDGELGEMGFKTWSNDMKNDIIGAQNNGTLVLVTATVDNLNKEYHCSFRFGPIDEPATICKTAVFSYKKKRWVRVNRHDVVFAGSLGAFNLTSTNPQVNDGMSIFAEGEGDPLIFYNDPVNFVLEYAVNPNPAAMKVFKNINLITDAGEKIFSARIRVPVTQSQGQEMETYLYAGEDGNWELLDGKQSAKIMGDINSPVDDQHAGNIPYLLACGQDMRGYVCIIQLTGNSANRYNIAASVVSFAATNPKL